MTFEQWFSKNEWWHENSRREDLKPVWDRLAAAGLVPNSILDTVIAAVRDEYGA